MSRTSPTQLFRLGRDSTLSSFVTCIAKAGPGAIPIVLGGAVIYFIPLHNGNDIRNICSQSIDVMNDKIRKSVLGFNEYLITNKLYIYDITVIV